MALPNKTGKKELTISWSGLAGEEQPMECQCVLEHSSSHKVAVVGISAKQWSIYLLSLEEAGNELYVTNRRPATTRETDEIIIRGVLCKQSKFRRMVDIGQSLFTLR